MALFAIAQNPQADDCKIIRDEIVEGVRYVSAIPSEKVCSRQIDIEIKDDVIQKVVYTRGCQGNGKGIGALIKGMTVDEAISRLDGITCGNRVILKAEHTLRSSMEKRTLIQTRAE